MPPEVTITAWAPEVEVAGGLASSWARRAAVAGGGEHPPAHAVDGAALGHQLVDPVAEPHSTLTVRDGLAHPSDERLEHARPGAPGDVEAGHRVAVPVARP